IVRAHQLEVGVEGSESQGNGLEEELETSELLGHVLAEIEVGARGMRRHSSGGWWLTTAGTTGIGGSGGREIRATPASPPARQCTMGGRQAGVNDAGGPWTVICERLSVDCGPWTVVGSPFTVQRSPFTDFALSAARPDHT